MTPPHPTWPPAAVTPAGAPRPEYGRFVPPGRREDPAAREVVEARLRVMEASGARIPVERRPDWRAGTPVPQGSGRLISRQVEDREDLVALTAPVTEGALDAHGQADLASAATDLGNVPMATAFARAGHRIVEERVHLM
ncbi:hypothetical protein K373_04442 [Streptomyces sp. DvalAA-21]|nr:hypothetical protein K373_04442 [Streptomyces sp. DvalAA-21]RAJ40643.1 hypothetical protein K351_00087 [Streptomyces sp. DpondAA-E10]RAJ45818.1 hypothetical protein K352_03905 [Streptomyces sp. DpondAA-A50]SCE12388.1 hypothetical protein GA0115235_11218 [Streptomyces sp. DpondAA-F4a]SCL88804.1 hypothetical protein SAMN04883147_103219 [Streptomyces sp. DpondAA-F4]